MNLYYKNFGEKKYESFFSVCLADKIKYCSLQLLMLDQKIPGTVYGWSFINSSFTDTEPDKDLACPLAKDMSFLSFMFHSDTAELKITCSHVCIDQKTLGIRYSF